MFCQRHPNRRTQCNCMALCTECRASHPHGCECGKRQQEREARLAASEEIQRAKKPALHLELMAKHTAREKKREAEYQAKILALERKIEELKIDNELELVQLERKYNAEKMSHYDSLSRELSRLTTINVVGVARGKDQKTDVAEREKEPSKALCVEENHESKASEVEVSHAEGREDNVETEDIGSWLTGPQAQQMGDVPEAPIPAVKKKVSTKAKAAAEKKATWERLTGKVKSLPKLTRGAGRSIARRGRS